MIQVYRNTGNGNIVVKFLKECGPNGIGVVSFYGCNLRCPFCFAQKYSYSNGKFSIDSKRKIYITESEFLKYILDFLVRYPDICYIQFTGGEPVANEAVAKQTIRVLVELDKFISSIGKEVRIVYQTNGYFIGSQKRLLSIFDELRGLKNIKILFEISIKGTNENEFVILSGISNKEGFKFQLNSYWMLRNLVSENIDVVARLGIGHHRKSIHFVDPETGQSLFRKSNWDSRFEEVFYDTTSRFGEKKMITECINAEGDGSVNNYLYCSIPAIYRCLLAKCIVPRDCKSKAIAKVSERYGDIFPWSNCKININKLMDDYKEFLKFFEPMNDPAHAYCGRNEFKPEHRKTCPSDCKYNR